MPKRSDVVIRVALIPGSRLLREVRDGLQALKKNDRCLIATTLRPDVGDSLDLDNATRAEFPNINRWDYLISIPRTSQIVGLEPHSARDSEISVVIAKKNNAVDYLRNHFHPNHWVSKWFWVTSGSVNFSKMDRARRQLDQSGIAFRGREIISFD